MTDPFSSASSAEFIQASRVLKIVSPLGEDQLLPERVVIEEGVNRALLQTFRLAVTRPSYTSVTRF